VYTLRAATSADFDWLRHLHHETLRDTITQQFGWDEPWQDAYFTAHFNPTDTQIVQAGGVDAGMIEVHTLPDELFLANILIVPAYANRGLGTALIRDLQQRAANEGVSVRLQVLFANPARVLYERLGFTEERRTETHHVMRWRAS